ncbi:GNAT family N-acetyltransferase [Halomonadaceae bacterium KBTZ08]
MDHVIQQLDMEDGRALKAVYDLFGILRPHLSKHQFMEQVPIQAAEGYRIACIEQDGAMLAAAGYRVATYLAWGRVLYIDDLVAHPERTRNGAGGALLDWLLEEGRRLGCAAAHLDTGYQRHDAHRLYLKKGFVLSSHHMSLSLC